MQRPADLVAHGTDRAVDPPYGDQRSSPARAAELRRFLTELREHADPALVPTNVTRRRHPGLSQNQVARVLGVTHGYYTKLEAGRAPWHPEYVDALARLFTFTPHQRTTLHRLALGWAPPDDPGEFPRGHLEALIDSVPFPAQLLSPTSDIEYCNEHVTNLCPPLKPGANLAKTILLDQDIRPCLHDWATGWALPAIGKLRSLSRRLPEQYHAGIDALIAEVLESREVRALWNQHRDAYLEPAVSRRQVLTDAGPRTVYCVTQSPNSYPYGRLTFTISADQLDSPAAMTALGKTSPPGGHRNT
jgi:transcriptional regulator with XRE-family HTH domain